MRGEHYDHDDGAPDGACEGCGCPLDDDPQGGHEDWHRYCWDCWSGDDQADDRGDERLLRAVAAAGPAGMRVDLPPAADYSLQFKLGYLAGFEAGWDAAREEGAA